MQHQLKMYIEKESIHSRAIHYRNNNIIINPRSHHNAKVRNNTVKSGYIIYQGLNAQVDRTTRQEVESALNDSKLTPAHVTVDSKRLQVSRNQIFSNVGERYEFVDMHNTVTDKQNFEHEDYSCLKY